MRLDVGDGPRLNQVTVTGTNYERSVDFYRRILGIGCDRQPCAEALRQAQQAIRTRDGGKYADPYYWGAFICQGDPAPLKSVQEQR